MMKVSWMAKTKCVRMKGKDDDEPRDYVFKYLKTTVVGTGTARAHYEFYASEGQHLLKKKSARKNPIYPQQFLCEHPHT